MTANMVTMRVQKAAVAAAGTKISALLVVVMRGQEQVDNMNTADRSHVLHNQSPSIVWTLLVDACFEHCN